MTTNLKANLFLRMTKFAVLATAPTELPNKDEKFLEGTRHPRDKRTFFKSPPAPNTSAKSLTAQDLAHETKKQNSLTEHPSVLIGSLLTAAALIYMVRSSLKGDTNAIRIGAQYRIVAQLATFVVCLGCAGFAAKTSMAKEK